MKYIITLASLLLATPTFADFSSLEKLYLSKGGNPLAFKHLNCISNRLEVEKFENKKVKGQLKGWCNEITNGENLIEISRPDTAVIVDYTQTSDKRRFFLLNSTEGTVQSFYVSHGRFKASRSNTTLKKNKNTIKEIKYYNNKINSNASSSGLMISGKRYQGKWRGNEGDKWSLGIYGIEKDINDNVCERSVVMHGNYKVNEAGENEGVKIMSSGCFMMDYDYINKLVDRIEEGAIFFVFSERESAFSADHYCTNLSQLRLK
ncbi:MAG: hypothetical protein EP326_04255 [Deltaproteobacteria bacterium]|nr:MAG: hypothetical protein EP326_04255 [Deltaproteobacteria bacterium]